MASTSPTTPPAQTDDNNAKNNGGSNNSTGFPILGLLKDLTATSPGTERSAAEARRITESTGKWQPELNRRQSWSQQEYKHTLQMDRVGKDTPNVGFGFTEHKH
ncbi:hypothetical protein B0T17DRAFT_613480 [Bombardia bombarda]|uniref:Uncharacterized protein n=1 Tax=Bombardia bombarda TaxID=252184 RepID=A0AA40CGM1_9PEZI|nr:hypothetical protein B0T17DRAFT_613480 [Bombardia bombarda]